MNKKNDFNPSLYVFYAFVDDLVDWNNVPHLKPESFDALCVKLALEYRKRDKSLDVQYLAEVARNHIIRCIRTGKYMDGPSSTGVLKSALNRARSRKEAK